LAEAGHPLGFIPGQGFGEPEFGSSFVQVVTWGRSPCPDAATILTYSESNNPLSPHYADQTRLFSGKRWVRDRFCRTDIRQSPRLQTTVLRGQ
jgi:acyl-homoserine-lactone acylase